MTMSPWTSWMRNGNHGPPRLSMPRMRYQHLWLSTVTANPVVSPNFTRDLSIFASKFHSPMEDRMPLSEFPGRGPSFQRREDLEVSWRYDGAPTNLDSCPALDTLGLYGGKPATAGAVYHYGICLWDAAVGFPKRVDNTRF